MIRVATATDRRRWAACVRATLGWGLLAGSAAGAVSDPIFGTLAIPVGAGPRALGMGGAFSAVADDATAATWNPGGMVQLERPELGASVGWYYRRVQQENGDEENRSVAEIDHASWILPFHALGFQQTVGVAWQRQFDFGRSVSASTQSSDVIYNADVDADGALATLGVSYAVELVPGLGLGATVHVWNDDLTGGSHYYHDTHATFIDLIPSEVSFGQVFTIDEQRETKVTEGYSGIIGLWWQALPELTISTVVKPTYTLRSVTDIHSQLTTDGIAAPCQHDEVRSDFHYPTSVTLGLAWRRGDYDTICCDTTWTQWSHYRLVTNGEATSPVNSAIAPDEFSDGISVRVGYEHLTLFDEFVLATRLGALYEEQPGASPTPSALETDSTHAVVDRYYGVTAGASLCYEHLLYDLGAQLRYGQDVGTGQIVPPDQAADITTLLVRLGFAYQF